MSCTAVTERASEGPCRHNFHDGRSAPCGLRENVKLHRYEYPPSFGAHTYLGPVLARCGHPESEHPSLFDWLDDLDDPDFFGEDDWHAYTEES